MNHITSHFQNNVHNTFKSNQHHFSKWFLGAKYPDKTVPLRDYEFTEDSLLYLEYGTPLDALLYKKNFESDKYFNIFWPPTS